MTINIGGEILKLTVPSKEKQLVRDAEKEVQLLYNDWSRRFPKCSPKYVLAMVAYQFSYYYQELLKLQNNALETADNCSKDLSDLILKAQTALNPD